MFTIKNAILVALSQVGTVVYCTLISGVLYRFHGGASEVERMPSITVWMVQNGYFLLVFPIAWIAWASWAEQSSNLGNGVQRMAFLSGVLVIGLFIGLFLKFSFAFCNFVLGGL